jgi:hypothetical protein
VDHRNLVLFIVGGLIVVLGLAFFVSPYASSSPDGLEKVSVDKGFADSAKESATAGSPLADYGVKGVENESLSTGLAGIIGVAITFGVGLMLFGLLRTIRARRRPVETAGTAAAP